MIQFVLPASRSFVSSSAALLAIAMTPPSLSSLDGPSSSCQEGVNESSEKWPRIREPWKLFPVSSYSDLLRDHGKKNVKMIHIVRHAEGTHNVLENYGDPANFDARLTPHGRKQCEKLAVHVKETMPELVENVEEIGVITSPMTRCVQTSLFSFPWLAAADCGVPFVAHESIRETVNYACDRRRPISEIAKDFPRVDFSLCDKDNDFIWDSYRNRIPDGWSKQMESGELNAVADRAVQAFKLLQERPEHHLIVCSHSAFLRCILNWGQTGGVPQMMPQILDIRKEKGDHKLFQYLGDEAWERHMRSNYENCELRSFCILVKKM